MSLSKVFFERYGHVPAIHRAPGRVNLIGEHTDYNDGYVLPAAIDLVTEVAIAPRDDGRMCIASIDAEEVVEFDTAELPRPSRRWHDYAVGVVAAMRGRGVGVRGANLLIRGTVPIGAGLSSSASLEVAVAMALLSNTEEDSPALGPLEVAELCRQAENEFVGTRCGIMDMYAAVFGRAGHALLLDCRSLESEPVRLPGDVCLVVCDTGVHHELAAGEYNRRRSECEEGVSILSQHLRGVAALRDVQPEQFRELRKHLPEPLDRRCRHVIGENQRTPAAARALRAGDLQAVGTLFAASHASLRDDYEVSCRELDVLVDLATRIDGVHAARMTGGGFGGSTINLVDSAHADDFTEVVCEGYRRETGLDATVRVCAPSGGAIALADASP